MITRKKLKGDDLEKALQQGHLRRMELRKYGSYNDYRLCEDCGNILDPGESCNCV